jgi:hypothetical protein
MPEKSVMILIDGAGWKTGAIKWLKDAVSRKLAARRDEWMTEYNTRLCLVLK